MFKLCDSLDLAPQVLAQALLQFAVSCGLSCEPDLYYLQPERLAAG